MADPKGEAMPLKVGTAFLVMFLVTSLPCAALIITIGSAMMFGKIRLRLWRSQVAEMISGYLRIVRSFLLRVANRNGFHRSIGISFCRVDLTSRAHDNRGSSCRLLLYNSTLLRR